RHAAMVAGPRRTAAPRPRIRRRGTTGRASMTWRVSFRGAAAGPPGSLGFGADGQRDLVDATVRRDGRVAVAFARQCAQGPRTGRGEEPELAGGRRHHLGGELTGGVEQPDVRTRHGRVAGPDDPGDDRLLLDVDARGDGRALCWRAAAGDVRHAVPPQTDRKSVV